jgi:hypothetical protein
MSRPPVKRYTLALMTPERTETQLRVGEFPQPERAIELAALIAAEMGLEEGHMGWSIEVRDPEGARLHAVQIVPRELALEPEASFAIV